MGAPIGLLADALSITLDDVTANVELAEAPETFDIPIGPIGKGSIGGYRFEVLGIVGGEAVLAVEHITRVHASVAPHWPVLEPGGFRLFVQGTPSYRIEVVVDEPDANVGACTGTAARAVNAVRAVCAAPPGVCSFLDLPLMTAGSIA
jgi:4-hydroxy-tetrahydrodipicolinate reductase